MGLSSSKSKTTSQATSTSSPLDQYAPYITQGLTSAKGIMDSNQGNMQMLGSKALDIANGFGAPNAALGSVYTGTNPAQANYTHLQSAAANDPSLGILSGLAGDVNDPSMAYLMQLAKGSTSPGQYGDIGQGNPALAALQDMTNGQVNGDSAQFYKDTLGGKYLNNNPYIDRIAQMGEEAALKATNQRFAASGMGAGMSTPYAQAAGSSIADANNQLRYGAYNNELNRMGQIGGQSDSEYNATKDRNLSAANGLGSLYNQTGALKLQAQQAMDSSFNADRNNQLAAALGLGGQNTADRNSQIGAASALGQQNTADNNTSLNATNASIQSILQALGLVPSMTGAQVNALGAAAQIPYTGLNNYASLVNGLTGKYGTTDSNGTSTTKSNQSIMSGLGQLGQAAGTAAMVFSDIRLKRDIEPAGQFGDGLGIYRYRYLWDDEPRVGVMAHEVAVHRPWALGPEIGGYATVNYGAL